MRRKLPKPVWWKWPDGYYETQYLPWYAIVWRVLWAPAMLVTGGLFLLVVAVAFGRKDAERVLREFT